MKTNGERAIGLIVGLICVQANAGWAPAPVEVHEWGVSVFDWSNPSTSPPDFPEFFYTDKSPGVQLPRPTTRVKDMEADSGMRIRTKPVLYFYGPDTLRNRNQKPRPFPVSVEVRFRDGYANAWWPQVNRYRTKSETDKASAPDPESWNRERTEKRKAKLKASLPPGEFEKGWAKLEKRRFVANEFGSISEFGGMPAFPDDERFQLVWEGLEISPKADPVLRGDTLADSHWVRRAREVDADYVSNGSEMEKFLFYEGRTMEPPAIAIVPNDRDSSLDPDFVVHNITEHPIHDVFILYRNPAAGEYWVGYFPKVQPWRKRIQDPPGEQSMPHVMSPGIPNFRKLVPDSFVSEAEFRRKTQTALAGILTMSAPEATGVYADRRNPALYQPPTEEHRLFPREVAAILAIWDKEFFGNDGLTILYRESTQYLDEAVPLRIYTDMHHCVNLSRCGLVANRRIDLERLRVNVSEINKALAKTGRGATALEPSTRAEILDCFQKDRFATLGQLQFYRLSGWPENLLGDLIKDLQKETR